MQNSSLQANGKVLAGGAFTGFGLTTRHRIARFDNGAATESLTAYTSTRVQWLRGGSDSSAASEPAAPATAPEPPSMPSEPAADAGAGEASEPAGDEPS